MQTLTPRIFAGLAALVLLGGCFTERESRERAPCRYTVDGLVCPDMGMSDDVGAADTSDASPSAPDGSADASTSDGAREDAAATPDLDASQPSVYGSCREIAQAGEADGDGVYTLTTEGESYDVYCDMTADGGGWTLAAIIAGDGTAFGPLGDGWTDATAADDATDPGSTTTAVSRAWSVVSGSVIRICLESATQNCATFTHNRAEPLTEVFSSTSKIETDENWNFADLASAWGRTEAFEAAVYQQCAINLAHSPARSGTEVDINTMGTDGAAVRIGCIGDLGADASGGPNDFALGIGASGCDDGFGCEAVGASANLYFQAGDVNGVYGAAYVYVR